jgi:hypothetical protein
VTRQAEIELALHEDDRALELRGWKIEGVSQVTRHAAKDLLAGGLEPARARRAMLAGCDLTPEQKKVLPAL